MQGINAVWLFPLIIVAGALQAFGPPMNGALRNALVNPWLASLVSFLPIVAFLGVMVLCMPRPLPTVEGLTAMPWWAPLGGLVGAVAVVVGLLFVHQVGAGTLAGLTITANILMSLLIDKFGLFGDGRSCLEPRPNGRGRADGGGNRADLEVLAPPGIGTYRTYPVRPTSTRLATKQSVPARPMARVIGPIVPS